MRQEQIITQKVKKILVVRNDRLGEFLLNIPALRALKETFPTAKVTVIINPYNHEFSNLIPFIDQTIEWGQERHSLSRKINLILSLRKAKFELAIMLNPSREFNIYTYLAGIPRRVGYDRKWGFLLTDKIKDKKYLAKKHEVEYNLELVGIIGASTLDKRLSLLVRDDIVKNFNRELFNLDTNEDFIIVHPWTSDTVKQWPLENFRQLVSQLIKELGLGIVIIGNRDNFAKSRIFSHLDEKVINLTGKTTLQELAGFLKGAKLLISGDSGPVHLAACVGTPVIALFRNDLVGKTAKRWGPWGNGHIVIEKENLQEITVSEVLDKVKEVLSR